MAPIESSSRRTFLKQLGAVSVLAGGAMARAPRLHAGPTFRPERRSSSGVPERPNILWLSCEDLSPRLGAYGDPLARTPHLDRLAEEGATYTRAFATNAACAPSRSCLMTGMYQTSIGSHPHRTGMSKVSSLEWRDVVIEEGPFPYQVVPPPYVKAFPEYLRAAGYHTINDGKTDYQFGEPFTMWDDSGPQAHWRDRPDPDQPFFAVFNNAVTHEGNIWPKNYADTGLTTDPADVTVPPYYPDTPTVRRDLARRYDTIATMDEWVGEHLRELETAGLAEDTIVMFWSDHGDGLPRAKEWVYDSGIRVPLIVRWPGHIEPDTVEEDPVSFVDMGPTVLSLAGVDVPAHMQGRAFLGARRAEREREYVYAARDRMGENYYMIRAVRDRRYKYIRNYFPLHAYMLWRPYNNYMPTKQEMLRLKAEGNLEGHPRTWWRDSRPVEELYDLREDPHEIHNLAGEPALRPELDRLRDALDAWRRRTGDLGDVPEYQVKERMWPGGEQPETAEPIFVPNAPGHPISEPVPGAADYEAPTEMAIYCPTQGASIAYTTDPAVDPPWKLYTGPVPLPRGTTTLRAKAVRYGYRESDEAAGTFTVT